MGNRISIKKRPSRRVIEERFTRPQRLVCEPAYIDYKKLKKLILTEKLAPCFDGVEDSNPDLEECPICFFYFPSLNRSKCCMKGICTECFLQMKPSDSTRPTQCPYCKYSIYAVEYRGARTKEEKSQEQAEEQKVIEAKIRMQSEESQDVNWVTLPDQILSGVEIQSPVPCVWQLPNHRGNTQDVRDSQLSFAQERLDAVRHEDFDVDLEEIMIAEAIWQSMQDPSLSQSSGPSGTDGLDSASHGPNGCRSSLALANQGETSSAESVTGGLAFAIARFAEQNIQHPDTFQIVHDGHTHQTTTDESLVEEYDRNMLRTICPDEARPTNAAAGLESDDVGSKIGCLGSSSMTDDDSWGSFAAHLLESQTSETGFVSDEDLLAEITDDGSCSGSSIHSVSDKSSGSPDCSDIDIGASYSHLSATISVQRPLVVLDRTS